MDSTIAFFEPLAPLFAALALLAGALWVGTLFASSWLCSRARFSADASELGTLAAALNRRWTTPFLAITLVSAVAWFFTSATGALSARWLYVLGVALVALVFVHASVRSRATRIEAGAIDAARGEAVARASIVTSLAVIVAVVSAHLVAAL